MDSIWQDFWFAPGSPVWLGAQRAFYCGVIFANVLLERRSRFLELSGLFQQPSFPLRGLPLPGPRAGLFLELIWKFSLLTACLGLATRCSLLAAACLSFYWFSLPNQFGVQHHRNHLTVQVLFLLALSSCGDAFSLDQLLSNSPTPPCSGQYTWPARLICLSLCAMFCAAGWSKIRWSGPGWVRSLPLYLVRALCLPYDARPLSRHNLKLARQRLLCQLGAGGVLALECLCPLGLLALLPGHPGFLLFPMGILVALGGIRYLLGPAFLNVAAAHIFWLTPAGVWDGHSGCALVGWLSLLVMGATSLCWLLQRDIFPFSNYPMYAWRCAPVLERLLLFGLDRRGCEIELWDRNQERLLPLDRWTLHLHLQRLSQRAPALRECLALARANGMDLSGLRLYLGRWEFSEDQALPPEPRLILLEELLESPDAASPPGL